MLVNVKFNKLIKKNCWCYASNNYLKVISILIIDSNFFYGIIGILIILYKY